LMDFLLRGNSINLTTIVSMMTANPISPKVMLFIIKIRAL
jgi:hypothetical protein